MRQTQAERVVEPYLELIRKYPDIQSMAEADVDELRSWFQPLGLFRRADRLIEASKTVISQYGGKVPNDLKDLLALQGLGDYSARAVLSLAYETPVPMIDEGVGRVFRRVFGLEPHGPAYSDRGVRKIAEEILPPESSREFNLGMLDIAAACCHVRNPECPKCPLMEICLFRRNQSLC